MKMTMVLRVTVVIKYDRDKSLLVVTKYFCRNKAFFTTNICRDKHNFDKHVFVATKLL